MRTWILYGPDGEEHTTFEFRKVKKKRARMGFQPPKQRKNRDERLRRYRDERSSLNVFPEAPEGFGDEDEEEEAEEDPS